MLRGFFLVPLSKRQPSFDAIESERLGSNVLLTRMRGHMSRALAEQQFAQFSSLVAETPEPAWIIEQLELTGFDPGAVPAGARWFSCFKDRGGVQVVIVSTLSAARMVAASLAFAVHAKVACCDTLKEAYERAGLGVVEARPSMFSLKPPTSAPPSRP
ncbi:MAG TPA: hypothetical protein VHB79_27145 [Polyangiaceae bacterium]|nr:hypothetical protein [Polyangiaceae bacterium]